MPPKENWINPKIEIRTIESHSKGMFAVKPITQGEAIILWGGNYINEKQAIKANSEGKAVVQFNKDLFSTENQQGDITYFINDSHEPNVGLKYFFRLETLRDIAIGEELTTDYSLWGLTED